MMLYGQKVLSFQDFYINFWASVLLQLAKIATWKLKQLQCLDNARLWVGWHPLEVLAQINIFLESGNDQESKSLHLQTKFELCNNPSWPYVLSACAEKPIQYM